MAELQMFSDVNASMVTGEGFQVSDVPSSCVEWLAVIAALWGGAIRASEAFSCCSCYLTTFTLALSLSRFERERETFYTYSKAQDKQP